MRPEERGVERTVIWPGRVERAQKNAGKIPCTQSQAPLSTATTATELVHLELACTATAGAASHSLTESWHRVPLSPEKDTW